MYKLLALSLAGAILTLFALHGIRTAYQHLTEQAVALEQEARR
jgi:hypothetical protein